MVFVLALAVAGIGALPRATASPVAAFGAVSVTAGASAVVESDSIRIPGPGVPATLPVLEIRGEVQRLILPTANLDGSLTDLDGRRFRLDADLLFRFDSADLTPAADAAIGELIWQAAGGGGHPGAGGRLYRFGGGGGIQPDAVPPASRGGR